MEGGSKLSTLHLNFSVRADLQSDRCEYKDLQSDKRRIANAHTQCSRIVNPSERFLIFSFS